ncbi:MAG: 4-alpha-glucanotransferase [Lachnospiraceae bacterium]|nr:4-alpha-glucanotransferase [Lachnospiraceae bacterium]
MSSYLERGAGVLMHISSLPSPYGIGTFGKEAYKFADQLVEAGQKYWQVLPLGPTSYGDSPYSSFSAFAGNPYFIDLDTLIEEGLIEKADVDSIRWVFDEDLVDFGNMYYYRFGILRKAFEKSEHKGTKDYAAFEKENALWLDDYALYMACKNYFDNVSWQKWDKDIKERKPAALEKYEEMLKEDVDFWKFLQYKFFEQWNKLKEYVNKKGILIIGDIPIYVALDSADVWANTSMFQMDKDLNPKSVAGVPPDMFSALGQRWGNPLYDWKKMEKDNFKWWRMRMSHSAKLYDIIRIDHFLGMVKYYSIPAQYEDAVNGEYILGPGMKLVKAINEAVGDKKIIAEDLGVEMPEAVKVLEESGYPGMKVMEFAFDGDRKNSHLPFYWKKNSVIYGGTHDNDTLIGYYSQKQDWELGYVREFLRVRNNSLEELVDELFRLAYMSVADVVIFQMQDVLKVGNRGRMNLPSSMGTNWRWRMKQNQFEKHHIERLRYLCDIYYR